MGSTAFTIIGILLSVLIFGFKIGAGCGFSNLKIREILAVGSSYFFLALIFGTVIDNISLSSFEKISSFGLEIHVFISLFLIVAGIYTQKKWHSGCDVSRHTFLFISMPCPACLAALSVSCMLLTSFINVGGEKIGLLVGTVFFFTVVGSSLLFRRMDKTPETLGTIMMFVGVYYLLGAMLIPAYLKTKQMNLIPMGESNFEAVTLFYTGLIILCGFFLGHIRPER